MIKYISFYTDGHYADIIEKYFHPSVVKFNLPYQIYRRPNLHDWLKNGKYKTEIILEALKSTTDDIVFLDADAEIRCFPELLYHIPEEYNIAVHAFDWFKFWRNKEGQTKREILTGTIYLRNNEETIKFVEEWNKLNQESQEWGQRILQKLLEQNKIKYYNLPFEYCRILRGKGGITSTDVIVQHQASREGKRNP
jgi:hypothetical protein